MENEVAVVSAAVAVLSAAVSGVLAWRANRVSERSRRDSYLERVRDWSDHTVEIVVELRRLCRDGCQEDEFIREHARLRTRLSAQIEKGRWFFPNALQAAVGQRKEAAYKGIRQPILDCLVDCYDLSGEIGWADRTDGHPALLLAQRAFVSEVQLQLDPHRRNKTYRLLLDRYRAIERHVGN